MSKVRDLTTGSIEKHLFQLSLPLLASSLIQMLYSFVDMAWLGRLSDESVAASGAASVFFWLAGSITLITKVGAEVTVANAIGRGDKREASLFARHSIQLALIIGTTLALAYLLFTSRFIGFYKLPEQVHAQAVNYMRIVSLGLPAYFMTLAFTGIYNASGNPQISFYAAASGLIMNMVLDPIFIFLLDMGIAGAAWATVISQTFVFIVFVILLYYKDKLLPNLGLLQRLQKHYTNRILKIGGPVGLMNSLYALINMSLGRFASITGGHLGVLTLTVGGQLEGICWNTAQSFSTALSTFVSQNYGARENKRVFRGLKVTWSFAAIIGFLGFFLYYFWGEGLFGLIVPEPEAIALGAVYLQITAFSQIFSMTEVTFQGFFFGLNRSVPPSIISIGGNLLRIPLAIILLPIYNNITVLWWIICGTSILKGIFAVVYYFSQRRRVDALLSDDDKTRQVIN